MDLQASRIFHLNWNSNKRIRLNRWWTRSTKTRSILQCLKIWLLTGRIWKIYFKNWVASIFRKYKATLRQTVLRDFKEQLEQDWLFKYVKEHKTIQTFEFKWRILEFCWADDQQKIRWWKRDILYCNEANELKFKDEFWLIRESIFDICFMEFLLKWFLNTR